MQTPDRSWLPTSTVQSVLVYALNVLLLFNLTVIVVLLSGESTEPAKRAQSPAAVIGADADQVESMSPPAEMVSLPVRDESAEIVSPEQVPAESVESVVLVDPAIESTVPEPIQPSPAAPVQDDPPVTFFGVGLD